MSKRIPTKWKQKRRRRHRSQLIRAFRRTYPNAPPHLARKIIGQALARRSSIARASTRAMQTIIDRMTLAWVRHHRTVYDRQADQAGSDVELKAIRHEANQQARQILEKWQ